MVNVIKLREAIKSSNHSIKTLSAMLDIDESTFYRKLNREGSTFTLAQADIIKRELRLSAKSAQEIFFAPDDTRTA